MKALISGGTGGIGLACCRLFCRMGYQVTALYSRDGEAADRARRELPGVRFLRADVSDEEAVKGVFSQTGTPDVLVNNLSLIHISEPTRP